MTSGARIQPAALREACRWLARLQSDDVSAEVGLAFDAWLRTSPSNVTAYREVLAAWHARQAMRASGLQTS